MSSRIVEISNCNQCPNKVPALPDGLWPWVPYCSLLNRKLALTVKGLNGGGAVVELVEGIPDWCPLEVAPGEAIGPHVDISNMGDNFTMEQVLDRIKSYMKLYKVKPEKIKLTHKQHDLLHTRAVHLGTSSDREQFGYSNLILGMEVVFK